MKGEDCREGVQFEWVGGALLRRARPREQYACGDARRTYASCHNLSAKAKLTKNSPRTGRESRASAGTGSGQFFCTACSSTPRTRLSGHTQSISVFNGEVVALLVCKHFQTEQKLARIPTCSVALF